MAMTIYAYRWIEFHHSINSFSTEIYVAVLGTLFTGMGVWIGVNLSAKRSDQSFTLNTQAVATLGLSARELEVLELLSHGGSNQEIANRLYISVSTVKSHLVHLYQKLGVSRRMHAVEKARSLKMIP
ncbi:MAG: LuxR C-terminal-related transcriptional regulator [Pseudomonadota bacterium]